MPVPIGIQLEIPESLDAMLKPRKRQRLMKRVYTLLGTRWGQEYLPKHFDRRQREYAMQPRAGDRLSGRAFWRSYQGKKKKKYGHTLKLVYTGDSARKAKRFRVHATGQGKNQGATVTVPTPTLNFKPGDLDMASEVRQVTPAERKSLVAFAEKTLVRITRELTGRRRVRIH